MSQSKLKRNCLNCANLENIDHSSYEYQDGGNCCNKREYRDHRDEGRHVEQLQDPSYLARSKRCFEPRNPAISSSLKAPHSGMEESA